MMSFPETVEEFMDSYKIVDTEGIYMNKGAEMVPIFRMKQWLEHISAQPEIIRCKDCKHWDKTWTNNWSPDYHYCPVMDEVRKGNLYCRYAERRTDE